MFVKHTLSLLIATAATCLAYHSFESAFDISKPKENATVAASKEQASDYISGSSDDNCPWVAVTVNEPIQCFANPIPMTYGPPSQYLLSKASDIPTVNSDLCQQISHLHPTEQGGAKTLLGNPVKWVCPINQT